MGISCSSALRKSSSSFAEQFLQYALVPVDELHQLQNLRSSVLNLVHQTGSPRQSAAQGPEANRPMENGARVSLFEQQANRFQQPKQSEVKLSPGRVSALWPSSTTAAKEMATGRPTGLVTQEEMWGQQSQPLQPQMWGPLLGEPPAALAPVNYPAQSQIYDKITQEIRQNLEDKIAHELLQRSSVLADTAGARTSQAPASAGPSDAQQVTDKLEDIQASLDLLCNQVMDMAASAPTQEELHPLPAPAMPQGERLSTHHRGHHHHQQQQQQSSSSSSRTSCTT